MVVLVNCIREAEIRRSSRAFLLYYIILHNTIRLLIIYYRIVSRRYYIYIVLYNYFKSYETKCSDQIIITISRVV